MARDLEAGEIGLIDFDSSIPPLQAGAIFLRERFPCRSVELLIRGFVDQVERLEQPGD